MDMPQLLNLCEPLPTRTMPGSGWTSKNMPWPSSGMCLANAPVTACFNPGKTTEISVDASPVGLGAILAQIDPTTKVKRIIAYASRSLTTTEQRYSQTEPSL
ncbi:Hypothetical predicted protein [Paramuricea clavata]|uniref:Reverse transcriptase/retrotransposon-derived protein RNase H-like domain-containing protein n=1 Tax=Paramuricea clavata TaxID=317549 RepID=A0A6S7GPT9_PARCT|nr:Hypothetical predicted protein [Paramuricea clavata]